MISAPASIAARATTALLVSIEIGICTLRRQPLDHRQHAAQFFVGSRPARHRAACFRRRCRAYRPRRPPVAVPCATAAAASKNCPPSEKLSGVTLTMPITSGRRGNSSVRVRSCQLHAARERSSDERACHPGDASCLSVAQAGGEAERTSIGSLCSHPAPRTSPRFFHRGDDLLRPAAGWPAAAWWPPIGRLRESIASSG